MFFYEKGFVYTCKLNIINYRDLTVICFNKSPPTHFIWVNHENISKQTTIVLDPKCVPDFIQFNVRLEFMVSSQ